MAMMSLIGVRAGMVPYPVSANDVCFMDNGGVTCMFNSLRPSEAYMRR